MIGTPGRLLARARIATCLGCAWLAGTSAEAQIPDEFVDLQVLPEDISKPELMQTMKGFTSALGVRCEHCHDGEPGMPLSSFDFASNEKPPKRIARTMLQMLNGINEELATSLSTLDRRPVEVQCVTCHRGRPVPRMLEEILVDAVRGEGAVAAVATYRDLREEHYGGFAYDFGEMTLLRAATAVSGDDPASAIELLELNLEFHPASWATQVQLGETHLAAGDDDEALAAFEKALEARPHPRLQERVDALRKSR